MPLIDKNGAWYSEVTEPKEVTVFTKNKYNAKDIKINVNIPYWNGKLLDDITIWEYYLNTDWEKMKTWEDYTGEV